MPRTTRNGETFPEYAERMVREATPRTREEQIAFDRTTDTLRSIAMPRAPQNIEEVFDAEMAAGTIPRTREAIRDDMRASALAHDGAAWTGFHRELNRLETRTKPKGKKMKRNRIRVRNGQPWVLCRDGQWMAVEMPASPFNLRRLHRTVAQASNYHHGTHERISQERSRFYSPTFGFELEGQWEESSPDDFKGDCSVDFRHDEFGDEVEDEDNGWTGETASPIFRDNSRQVAWNWLDDNHPDNVNETCGMHVHLGGIDWTKFTKQSTQRFLKTTDALKLHYPTRNRLRKRIAGENRQDGDNYCRPGIGYHDRYHHFNAGPAFQQFGTLEIRVLPMGKNVAESRKMIEFTQNFANRYWRS